MFEELTKIKRDMSKLSNATPDESKKIYSVVVPWCNPLALQPEQSGGGVGSNPGRAPPLERYDKGSRTRLGLLYFCDPSA